MTVYVDTPVWPYRGKLYCHMIADTEEELHSFAQSIGLKREWFQNKRIPHYDMVEWRQKIAIAKGAKYLSRRDFGQKLKELRRKKMEDWIPAKLQRMLNKLYEYKGQELDNHVIFCRHKVKEFEVKELDHNAQQLIAGIKEKMRRIAAGEPDPEPTGAMDAINETEEDLGISRTVPQVNFDVTFGDISVEQTWTERSERMADEISQADAEFLKWAEKQEKKEKPERKPRARKDRRKKQ